MSRRTLARSFRGSVNGVRTGVAWVGLILMTCCLWALGFEWNLNLDWRPLFVSSKPGPQGFVVLVDPGHGGHDTGAQSGVLKEKDLNLDVAIRVKKLMTRHQIPVRLTREDDRFVTLSDRVRQANAIRHGIMVSIHFNHSIGGRASGIETLFSGEGSEATPEGWIAQILEPAVPMNESEDLAKAIQQELIRKTSAEDRGVKNRRLYVTRNSRIPAVLVEGGFVNNDSEAQKIKQESYRQILAEGIVSGILAYRDRSPAHVNTD